VPAGQVLLIGSTGFAGGHFVEAARAAGREVVTAARRPGAADLVCDLLEPETIEAALGKCRPDAVVNLAGVASVGWSWNHPAAAFAVNAAGALNLLEAVAGAAPEAHVTCVSSGEVYGAPADEELPLGESARLRPVNPYGTSKAAMELACGQYGRSGGLRIAVMRAFNHLGPGQSDAFAASSFARQIATAEAEGRDRVELRTGDLSPERDFSDVRDVVDAYRLAVERELTGTFNVCSGRATRLEALVSELGAHARVEVEVRLDETRLRPAEAPRVFGSYGRLREATGWEPQIPLDRTLGDLLDWWRERLAEGSATSVPVDADNPRV
jgi:GDP-4-dehydro-6-deoxy-D-mannose reductase